MSLCRSAQLPVEPMEPQYIRIRGARMHNLKNISVDLPRNRLIVFTGLSGSGKSTLAFDTLYAEGQRRYVESLSTYARQFLGQMDKPEVDRLDGLSPAVAIEQKTTGRNPRSTVGTVTEIYDYLRLLFARAGQPHCPQCGAPIRAQSIADMIDLLMAEPEGTKCVLLAPVVRRRKGEHEQVLQKLRREGYVRVRVDGEMLQLAGDIRLEKTKFHSIEAVIDRVVIRAGLRRRLDESVSTAVKLGSGVMIVLFPDSGEERLYSESAACHQCGISVPALTPQLFSFNNPQGACPDCDGLGVTRYLDEKLLVPDASLSIAEGAIRPWYSHKLAPWTVPWMEALSQHYHFEVSTPFERLPERVRQLILYGSGEEKIALSRGHGAARRVSQQPFEGLIPRLNRLSRETSSVAMSELADRYMSERECPACKGARLKPEALAVRVGPWGIRDMSGMAIERLASELEGLSLEARHAQIAAPVLKEIRQRLRFLKGVGLGYLTLARSAGTLSGGEAQRIRLASQIGSGLAGVLYILDEPSIGLHQRDNHKLIKTLVSLRDLGNTVIVVEHDSDTIATADHVLDIGPGAGVHGGEVLYSGPVAGLLDCEASLTGGYLSGRLKIAVPKKRRPVQERHMLELRDACVNNLKHLHVRFPLGLMTCVTGVSGSGKSSLVMETLLKEAERYFNDRRGYAKGQPQLFGLEQLDKVIDIDQSPIGRTPRSNPATYTGVMSPVRELMAQLPESRARGYKAGRFSFNVKGGRCETCEGDGVLRIAMHFLPDVYVECERCHGRRYNAETLDIRYKGKNIADILDMTVAEALDFFQNLPGIQGKLKTIVDVGLGYVRLGQSSVTLSGGEAQRMKLAKELSRRATGRTLYILDEPTTGLHPDDIRQLLDVLGRLVAAGNTVVVIEHNLDVIKTADYIIDIGPEGGEAGGGIVATGTPEEVAACPQSFTGKFLQQLLPG